MTVRKSFLSFAKRVLDEKQNGVCLVIKSREGQGIVADSYIPQNLTRSGADNSGAVFHPQPEWHSMSEAAYQEWISYLSNKENADKLFQALAQQEGVLVILVNNKICKLVSDTPSETIFTTNPKGAGRKPVTDKATNRSVKFTDAEWEELQIKAKAEGISRAEYIKRKAL